MKKKLTDEETSAGAVAPTVDAADAATTIEEFISAVELTELHTHIGFGISPTMLWEIAHDQGILLPTKNYWDFVSMITIHEKKTYEEYLQLYDWTEKIQSSPEALFYGVQNMVSRAYRKNNITTIELRFNPVLRNREKEKNLDHLIVFALQGMERAMLKYPVKVGMILMMDRRFNYMVNEAVLKKALKYKRHGIVGIDLAGPIDLNEQSRTFRPRDIKPLIDEAHKHGIGVTIHTGEATGIEEMWEVLKELRPNRIGHGIVSVKDPAMLKYLAANHIILETCPISNINTKLIKDFGEMRQLYAAFKEYGVPFTINTDGPEMQLTSLRKIYQTLYDEQVLTVADFIKANQIAKEGSFIKHV
jgi:adenosine deaminase